MIEKVSKEGRVDGCIFVMLSCITLITVVMLHINQSRAIKDLAVDAFNTVIITVFIKSTQKIQGNKD